MATSILECERCGTRNRTLIENQECAVCAACGSPLSSAAAPEYAYSEEELLDQVDLNDAAAEWQKYLEKEHAPGRTVANRILNHPIVTRVFQLAIVAIAVAVMAASVGITPARVEQDLRRLVGKPKLLKAHTRVNDSLGGRLLFPASSPWNTPVDRAPRDARSERIIESIGRDKPLEPGFGEGKGFVYVTATRGTRRWPIYFTKYGRLSDQDVYPVPPDASLVVPGEIHGNSYVRRDVLVLEQDQWKLYELGNAFQRRISIDAEAGAVFDLRSGKPRPRGRISVTESGLPVLPGLVRYDEVVEQGVIRHALSFTVAGTRKGFVEPATYHTGRLEGDQYPPMGMRVRLRRDFDLSPFPKHARVVLQALKTYGMFLSDTGPDWRLDGTDDERWGKLDFSSLAKVLGRDLEVVKMGKVHTMELPR
jgi:hypothetical protein